MLFQSDITQLETELLSLQQRINQMREAEAKTEVTTSALKELIVAVQPLGKLSDLKAEVLALFNDSDDDDGGNGNNDTKPTPSDDEPCGVRERSYHLEPETLETDRKLFGEAADNIEPSPLTDVSSAETVSETTPKQEVLNRLVKGEYLDFVALNDTVAYFQKDEQILTTYIGGSNKARLNSWGQFLTIRHVFGCGYEVRPAKRMAEFGWKHELKLHGMNVDAIAWLAQQDFKKSPPSEAVEQYRRPVPPAYTKPTHTLRVNGSEAFQGSEDECRKRYEDAIANPDSRFVKLIDNHYYTVVLEFDRDAEEAQTEVESANDVSTLDVLPMEQNQDLQPTASSGALTYFTGDEVEITSSRHGAELVQRIGTLSAVSKIGAVVKVADKILWFGFDEFQPIANTIQPPLPKQEPSSPYRFVLGDCDNIFTEYRVYEGDRWVGKVSKSSISEKWTYKHGGYHPTKEAAAAAMDALNKRDDQMRKELGKALIEQYAS